MEKHDFLVIGSGTAGLIFALEAAKHGKVLVISKLSPDEGNTKYAQGGIASVLDKEDSFESHIQDTLVAGAGLCDTNTVSFVISQGPKAINTLVRYGVRFDTKEKKCNESTDDTSDYSLGKEGGHQYRRILHWGDSTGAEIQRALLKAAEDCPNIEIRSKHTVIDLICDKNEPDQHSSSDINNDIGKRISGAYVFDERNDSVVTICAKIICIATGGLGKVYKYTSNPNVATGDGVAIAQRAGAKIANMEFIQFHPTCLYHAYANTFLITEAMRGEGAILKRKDGHRFMPDYHHLHELAPRDIVARAIDHELKKTGDDYVLLDISHKSKDFIEKRFPQIYETLFNLGIDISISPIPVVPAAHYSCGGIIVDHEGKTNIENLYAAGEVTCTGLHGANRLASNSLLEAVIYGLAAAKSAAATLSLISSDVINTIQEWDSLDTKPSKEAVLISHLWDEVRLIMWNLVGIVRSNSRLELAKRRLEACKKDVTAYYWKYKIDRNLLELRNLVEVALLIVDSAIKRKESIGLHYNIDYLSQIDT